MRMKKIVENRTLVRNLAQNVLMVNIDKMTITSFPDLHNFIVEKQKII